MAPGIANQAAIEPDCVGRRAEHQPICCAQMGNWRKKSWWFLAKTVEPAGSEGFGSTVVMRPENVTLTLIIID
jgi:hypothetical protein